MSKIQCGTGMHCSFACALREHEMEPSTSAAGVGQDKWAGLFADQIGC